MVFSAASPTRRIRDVWAWNFVAEFDELLAAVARCDGALIALDTEFPGFLCEDPVCASKSVRYWALRENVDMLRPIQFGLAVADTDQTLHGIWTFNLWFDLTTNLYTEASIRFLSDAGVDFRRHAFEGIHPDEFAWRLAASPLVGALDNARSPHWITFSGWYDWGYVMRLLTCRPMPLDLPTFERLLAYYCPRRHDLRDTLPQGSLDCLMAIHGIPRFGSAHTAGSDALGTLELYLRVGPKIGGNQFRNLSTPAEKPKIRSTAAAFRPAAQPLLAAQDHSQNSVAVLVANASHVVSRMGANVKVEEVATVNDFTSGLSGDTEADGTRSEFDEEEEDEDEDIEDKVDAYSSDSANYSDDDADQPQRNQGWNTEDRAQNSLDEQPEQAHPTHCRSDERAPNSFLATFGLAPLVATVTSAFVLLQVIPTIMPLCLSLPRRIGPTWEIFGIRWLLTRSVQSVALQKLALVLSSLSVVVFGCFVILF